MAITKEISREKWEQMKLANFKAHVVGPIADADITRGAWTSFGGSDDPFHFVESESYGDLFKLASDKSTVIIKEPVLFEFAGCVHYINTTASTKTIKIGCRIYKNGKNEARCSQVFHSNDMKQLDGESTLKYTGTDVTHKNNEHINLQYYLYAETGLTINFSTDAAFDQQVAATIYLKVVGLPQYTERNEKINWIIT
jgi:hypothetical protein